MFRNGKNHPELRQQDVGDLSRDHLTAHDSIKHAVLTMEAALRRKRYIVGLGPRYLEMRRDVPYRIDETDQDGVQLLLNRNYKPLGSNESEDGQYLEYETFPHAFVRLTPAQIAEIVMLPDQNRLFDDANAPWVDKLAARAYTNRLRRLLACLSQSG